MYKELNHLKKQNDTFFQINVKMENSCPNPSHGKEAMILYSRDFNRQANQGDRKKVPPLLAPHVLVNSY